MLRSLLNPEYESIRAGEASIDSEPASYHLTTDGSTIDAIPQASGLSKYTGQSDIGSLLTTLIKDELPPTGTEKEAVGKILLKRGDYPGTLSGVPLASQLAIVGEQSSHYVSGGDLGRPQTEPPVTLHGASGTEAFRAPNVDTDVATFGRLRDIEVVGPGATDTGSRFIDNTAGSNKLDWTYFERVVAQKFETVCDLRNYENGAVIRDCHFLDFSGYAYRFNKTAYMKVRGTSTFTNTSCEAHADISNTNVFLNQNLFSQGGSSSTTYGAIRAAVKEAMEISNCFIRWNVSEDALVLGGDSYNQTVVRGNVLTTDGDGQAGIRVKGNPIKNCRITDNRFDGGWSECIHDYSNGSNFEITGNVSQGDETVGLKIDGSVGTSDYVIDNPQLGSGTSLVNSPTRIVKRGRYIPGTEPTIDIGGTDGKISPVDNDIGTYHIKVDGDSGTAGASVNLQGVDTIAGVGTTVIMIHTGDDTITLQDVSNSGVLSNGFENPGGTNDTLDANGELARYDYDGTHWRQTALNTA